MELLPSKWWTYANFHTEKYLQMLKDHRVRGYLFEQQNYVTKK